MEAPTPLSPFAAWLLAIRPRTLPAAAAPVFVGASLAAHHDAFVVLPALAALVGALLIQIATNLANDYYDFVKGADTEDRIGPVRVTQAGLLPAPAVRRAMVAALSAALLVGAYLVWVGGWPVLVIGLASLVSAVGYTAGPFPLAYHGLGDPFVFFFFGPVATAGTYFVQTLALSSEAVLAGVGLGALSTAILVVNNLRDRATDERAGKRTLAVRMGVRASRVQYALLLAASAAVPPLGMTLFGWPGAVLSAWVALGVAAFPARRVLRYRDPRELVPALGQTARVLTVYGLLLGSALALKG